MVPSTSWGRSTDCSTASSFGLGIPGRRHLRQTSASTDRRHHVIQITTLLIFGRVFVTVRRQSKAADNGTSPTVGGMSANARRRGVKPIKVRLQNSTDNAAHNGGRIQAHVRPKCAVRRRCGVRSRQPRSRKGWPSSRRVVSSYARQQAAEYSRQRPAGIDRGLGRRHPGRRCRWGYSSRDSQMRQLQIPNLNFVMSVSHP